MIRTACAWFLLLLAASPVTAPFSTCDLRLFAANTASIESAAAARLASISATENDGGDAYSLSPLTRIVLPADDSTTIVTIISVPVTPLVAIVPGRSPRDLNRSPHDSSASPTVLRL